jgi:hypothetical protein
VRRRVVRRDAQGPVEEGQGRLRLAQFGQQGALERARAGVARREPQRLVDRRPRAGQIAGAGQGDRAPVVVVRLGNTAASRFRTVSYRTRPAAANPAMPATMKTPPSR